MTRSHFIEILMILTKYLFDLGVRLTEFSVTVESVTLRFYCTIPYQVLWLRVGNGFPFDPVVAVVYSTGEILSNHLTSKRMKGKCPAPSYFDRLAT